MPMCVVLRPVQYFEKSSSESPAYAHKGSAELLQNLLQQSHAT